MKTTGRAISPFDAMIVCLDRFFRLEFVKLNPFFVEEIGGLSRHSQRAERPCSNDKRIGMAVERPLEIVDVKTMSLFANPGRENLVSQQYEIPCHRPFTDLHTAEAVRSQLSHKDILAIFATL